MEAVLSGSQGILMQYSPKSLHLNIHLLQAWLSINSSENSKGIQAQSPSCEGISLSAWGFGSVWGIKAGVQEELKQGLLHACLYPLAFPPKNLWSPNSRCGPRKGFWSKTHQMGEISSSLGVVSDKLKPLQLKLGCQSPSAEHSHPIACSEPPWGADPAPEKIIGLFGRVIFGLSSSLNQLTSRPLEQEPCPMGRGWRRAPDADRVQEAGCSLTRPSPLCCSRHQP